MICETCIDAMRTTLKAIENSAVQADADHLVAGAECVFCERILTLAKFSLRRWIFGVCDTCACSIARHPINYVGQAAKAYEF
jgi:hypothetical protein